MSHRKWLRFLGSVLLAASFIVGSNFAQPTSIHSQTTDPYRKDWQPLARINPQQPVQIRVSNDSGESIDYILMGHTEFRRLLPGKSANLTKVPLPADLTISPIRDRIHLHYKVTVKGNQITVQVLLANNQGESSVEIDQTGAVYVY